MPAALASAAVVAVTRLRRDRCEPVKVLATRRRPVWATGGHAMGHILASDHGSALTSRKAGPWPAGHGQSILAARFRKQAIRGKAITRADQPWGNGLDIPDARGGKVGCVANLKCQVAKRPDGFHRHKPLRSEGGWG
jgi:hypothetical protein